MSEESEVIERPDEFLAFARFKEEIEKQAIDKAEKILAAAKEEAAKIKVAGKKEADKYKSDLLNKAKNEAQQIKVREVSRKKLNVKMDYLETRDKVFDEILVETRSKLQQYTKSDSYSGFLKNLMRESALSMNGGDLIVHLRSEDKSLLNQGDLDSIAKEITEASGLETKLSIAKTDLKALGGLKLMRSDGRLYVDNTFESRLNRSEEEIRVTLVDILEN
ncbi:MAG: hypothetical protein INQ03_07580 [Candidatus Heimdallarchaeota archaeon]|nr:hypothetical protein [Candidatus Heimdallarchaeota archaeon]